MDEWDSLLKIGFKTCTQCCEIKPRVEFNGNKRSKDRLQCHCKKCHYENNKKYRLRPEVKIKNAKRQAVYTSKNKEKVVFKNKLYRISKKIGIKRRRKEA